MCYCFIRMAPEVIVTETCKDDPYDYKVIVILIVLSIAAINIAHFAIWG